MVLAKNKVIELRQTNVYMGDIINYYQQPQKSVKKIHTVWKMMLGKLGHSIEKNKMRFLLNATSKDGLQMD